jgi:hypothetical protein
MKHLLVAKAYFLVAALIAIFIASLPFLSIPGSETFILRSSYMLVLLSSAALALLLIPSIRNSAMSGAPKAFLYPSIFLIAVFFVVAASLLVLPIKE